MTETERDPGDYRDGFALLGHDLRLDIVLALLEGWQAAQTEPRRYSDLMRAVGTEDSGKFNYHLGRLRGAYLKKVDGGYVPTASATALYRTVLANRPTDDGEPAIVDPGCDCPDCGAKLLGRHEDGFFTLRCPDCGSPAPVFTYPLPRNAIESRSDERILATVYERARSEVGLARTGQCPDCGGRTTVAIDPDDDVTPVEIGCDTRSWVVGTGFVLPLLSDARAVAALVDIGLPVETAYDWELPEPPVHEIDREDHSLALLFEGANGSETVVVDRELTVQSIGETVSSN